MNISNRMEVCSCLAAETPLFDVSPYVASEPVCQFETLSFPLFFVSVFVFVAATYVRSGSFSRHCSCDSASVCSVVPQPFYYDLRIHSPLSSV
jgi:hypothetical protein